MAAIDEDFDDGAPSTLRYLPWIVGGVLLVAAAFGVWQLMHMTIGKEKPAPPATTALLLPPPPPPPPPPPQETPPEPVDVVKPVPVEIPTPAPEKAEAPAETKIDAAAEAGGDSYGIQGGGPGGMGAAGSGGTGTGAAGGISDAFYGQSLRNALQSHVQDDDRVNRQVFTADFAVWVDGHGHVTRAELLRSSGDGKRDKLITTVLLGIDGLDPPPASIHFPARISVRGRKSL